MSQQLIYLAFRSMLLEMNISSKLEGLIFPGGFNLSKAFWLVLISLGSGIYKQGQIHDFSKGEGWSAYGRLVEPTW